MSTILDVTVLAGDGFSGVVKKGQTMRMIDLEGNQAADTLLYNAHDFTDRYSAVDTITAQGNIYLTKGRSPMPFGWVGFDAPLLPPERQSVGETSPMPFGWVGFDAN